MRVSGNEENIPGWVRWIAQDADGGVWGYEAEPHMHDSGWYENEVGRAIKLKAGELNTEWESSLLKKAMD